MENFKKYWGQITFIFTVAGVIITLYTNTHMKVYNYFKGEIEQEEVIKPKLEKILPHADSISYYKIAFFDLKLQVERNMSQNKVTSFQAQQSMKMIYYYVMVYERVYDQHGCPYHLRRFPDDGSPQSVAQRDYWKMVDGIIYLVETSREGAYYNDINNKRIQMKHHYPGSSGQDEDDEQPPTP